MKETKEEVVDIIMTNAEQRPWKVASAIMGKLPAVYMRTRNMTYEQAIETAAAVSHDFSRLSDDEDPAKIRSMLLSRIDLGE